MVKFSDPCKIVLARIIHCVQDDIYVNVRNQAPEISLFENVQHIGTNMSKKTRMRFLPSFYF